MGIYIQLCFATCIAPPGNSSWQLMSAIASNVK